MPVTVRLNRIVGDHFANSAPSTRRIASRPETSGPSPLSSSPSGVKSAPTATASRLLSAFLNRDGVRAERCLVRGAALSRQGSGSTNNGECDDELAHVSTSMK